MWKVNQGIQIVLFMIIGLVGFFFQRAEAAHMATISVDDVGQAFVLELDKTTTMNVYLTFTEDDVNTINQYYRTYDRVAVTWALTFGYESFNSSDEAVQPLDAASVSLSTVRPGDCPYPSFFDHITFAESAHYDDWLFRSPDNTYNWTKDKNEWDMCTLNMYDRAVLTSALDTTTFFLGTLSVTRNANWVDDDTTFMVQDQLVVNSGLHVTEMMFRNAGSSPSFYFSSRTGSLAMGNLPVPEPCTWVMVIGCGVVGLLGMRRSCGRQQKNKTGVR